MGGRNYCRRNALYTVTVKAARENPASTKVNAGLTASRQKIVRRKTFFRRSGLRKTFCAASLSPADASLGLFASFTVGKEIGFDLPSTDNLVISLKPVLNNVVLAASEEPLKARNARYLALSVVS